MILVRGDITTVTSGIIAHQVNARGVMGSGIAKQLKAKYLDMYLEYANAISNGELTLGMCQLVQVSRTLYIANLVGQADYGRDGKQYTDYVALDSALAALAKMKGSLPVHHPLISCGLGGGSWDVVSALIEKNLGSATTLWIYE